MTTGGGQGAMTLTFKPPVLKQLDDPNTMFSDARAWTKYIGVVSERPTYVVTNFTRKERIRQDFFSGPRDVEENLENVMRQFDTDRHVFIDTSDEDRAVAEETGWECLPVRDATKAAEWVLASDDDTPTDPLEAKGRDDWLWSEHSGAFARDSVPLSKALISNDTFYSSMSHQLPDVQASQPGVTVGLNQVGVTSVKKLAKVAHDGKRSPVLMAEFEVFVDLPSGRKGIDISRNTQVIDEVLEAAVSEPAYHIEDMCGDTAERLLAKYEYTTTTKVSMTTELVVREDTPASSLSTQSTAEVIASATVTDEGTCKEIGAEVVGITVCPCSQGMSVSHARDVLQDLTVDDDTVEEFLDKVPQPGHPQRGHATLTVETQGSPGVDPTDFTDITHDSMLTRICNLARRSNEGRMAYHVHANAKFAKDCVRSMTELSLEALDHLGDDAVVHMKQSNDESIHQHNAHAEREVTLGQLHDELDA